MGSTAAVTASAAPGAPANIVAARAAAQQFTSFFLQQSFESMFEGVGSDTLFGGGEGETIYRSLLLQQYSKIASQTGGGLGIADAVQREILQAQEAQ